MFPLYLLHSDVVDIVDILVLQNKKEEEQRKGVDGKKSKNRGQMSRKIFEKFNQS